MNETENIEAPETEVMAFHIEVFDLTEHRLSGLEDVPAGWYFTLPGPNAAEAVEEYFGPHGSKDEAIEVAKKLLTTAFIASTIDDEPGFDFIEEAA